MKKTSKNLKIRRRRRKRNTKKGGNNDNEANSDTFEENLASLAYIHPDTFKLFLKKNIDKLKNIDSSNKIKYDEKKYLNKCKDEFNKQKYIDNTKSDNTENIFQNNSIKKKYNDINSPPSANVHSSDLNNSVIDGKKMPSKNAYNSNILSDENIYNELGELNAPTHEPHINNDNPLTYNRLMDIKQKFTDINNKEKKLATGASIKDEMDLIINEKKDLCEQIQRNLKNNEAKYKKQLNVMKNTNCTNTNDLFL